MNDVGILVFSLATIVVAALAVLCIPPRVRSRRMQRVAKKYALNYERTTRPRNWFSFRHPIANANKRLLWKENILTGIINTHKIVVFDSCQIYGFYGSSYGSTHKTTYIRVDGEDADSRLNIAKFFGRKMSVSQIDDALGKVRPV